MQIHGPGGLFIVARSARDRERRVVGVKERPFDRDLATVEAHGPDALEGLARRRAHAHAVVGPHLALVVGVVDRVREAEHIADRVVLARRPDVLQRVGIGVLDDLQRRGLVIIVAATEASSAAATTATGTRWRVFICSPPVGVGAAFGPGPDTPPRHEPAARGCILVRKRRLLNGRGGQPRRPAWATTA